MDRAKQHYQKIISIFNYVFLMQERFGNNNKLQEYR